MKIELLYEQSIVAQEDEGTEKEGEMDEGAGDDEGMGTGGNEGENDWEGHKEDEPAEM